jgi:hypothetical protein
MDIAYCTMRIVFRKKIDQILLPIAGHDNDIGDIIVAKPVDDPSDYGLPRHV